MEPNLHHYVHGRSDRESERLYYQASGLADLLHSDTRYLPGERVLEAACGVGAQTVILAKNSPGAEFSSVDISPESLALAKDRIRTDGVRNVTLFQGDVCRLPFRKESFDHVFICFLLEHLPESVRGHREVHGRGRRTAEPAIEPLPEFLPYQAFAYGASDLRSPFDPPLEVKPVDPMRRSPDVKPNFDRVKQYLEQFNMSELAMVGTLAQGSKMYALMRDARGGVHRVQTGDYMGTDHGKIVAIDESTLEMLEIVSDGAGGWVERERTVSLGGAES